MCDRTIDLDDPRIAKAAVHVKAARAALIVSGHTFSCVCNLCRASRDMLAVFGILAEVDAEILEMKARVARALAKEKGSNEK